MSLDIVFLGFWFIVSRGCKVPDVGTIEVDLSHNLLSILTNLAISVVEVQLTILNDQFIVGHPKLGPVGSTDASLGPTLAVDKRSTDVELVGTRNMTIDSGPFVVGVVSLEAAEVVGEARVGVGHAAASVTCWRDGTRGRKTPSEQIFTVGGVDQLRLRLCHIVSTFKIKFGLNMGPITGRIRANGAQFVFQVDLTITGVNPEASLTWNHLTQVLLNHLTSRGLDKTCSSMVGTVGLEYEYEYDHPIVGVVSDLVILTWQRQRAKVNLAIWTLDTALGDVVWRTRQPRLPLPYVVTPVVLVQENRLPHGDVVVTDEDDVNSNILVIIITTFGVTGQLHPQIRVIGQVHGVREANGLVRTRLVGVSTHVEVECFIVVFDNIVLDIIVEATEVE